MKLNFGAKKKCDIKLLHNTEHHERLMPKKTVENVYMMSDFEI
jgi:hypothetical protein